MRLGHHSAAAPFTDVGTRGLASGMADGQATWEPTLLSKVKAISDKFSQFMRGMLVVGVAEGRGQTCAELTVVRRAAPPAPPRTSASRWSRL